ncbi:hypothetical protein [Qaidamihabitans albus]|uniref:hypothetical protein n=1 Tax=Qaidamihabitans albus TaxID=2795733 RepID=UPI0018F2349B|nr:hypothetical protein [Qaidamihabitans albus]
MKRGAQVAMGVGAGYLLGRTRKMRLALMMAGAGATGRLGVSPGELVQRGAKRLTASPELGRLTETVRGELLGAAKSAAATAASGRIESLNERIQSGGRTATGSDEPAEPVESTMDRTQGSADDEAEISGTVGESDSGDESEQRPARQRRSPRAGTSTGRAPVRRTRR